MELRPYKRKLEGLAALIANIQPSSDWAHIVGETVQLIGADRGTLYQVSADGSELSSTVVNGDAQLDISLDVGKGLAGWVAMAGVPLVINDVLKDDRFDARWDRTSGYTTSTVLAVPVSVDGRILGVLQLLNKEDGFGTTDRLMLEAIAHAVGLAKNG